MAGKSLLVLDSYAKTRRILVNKLEKMGHKVVVVKSFDEANTAVKEAKFDALIIGNTAKGDDALVEWAKTIQKNVIILVFDLTKRDPLTHRSSYFNFFDRAKGYGPILEYISKL
jgi:DNA-binding NtrC family response regulator